MIGTTLGPYQVTEKLGEGGMGEVYRAHDSRLKRDVAIKVLPALFAADEERLARFAREAQMLAALSHPNIAAIYGIEEAGDVRALVMEYVDGVTLAERLAQGALTLDEALPIARQIAEALETAHEKGIIHRDLKPANVALTADGQVKVLDFGLAKAFESPAARESSVVSISPTITTPAMTQAGLILGTAAYMSPEQAKGRPLDKRTDVWAFGCVLYEMLTGKRPFDGEDVTDTIAAVVRGEPDWNALPADVPPQLKLLITRCLVKDRKQRISDMGVARFLLNETLPPVPAPEPITAAPAPSAPPRKRVALIASATLVAGAALTAAAFWIAPRVFPPPAPQPMRFAIALPQPLAIQGVDRDIAISPQGTHIVYRAGTGQSILMLRPIDQLEGQPLAAATNPRAPFFSPDGQWIGFFSGPELKKVSVTGGPAISLCRLSGAPRGAAWTDDDHIVFATSDNNTGLQRVPAGGGDPVALTKPDSERGENDHVYPFVLPNTRGVLFTVLGTGSGPENFQVAVLDSRTNAVKSLVRGGSTASYVNGTHLVYAAAGTLRAVGFDLERLEVTSDPVPVVEQVLMTTVSGAANYSVSRGGTLIYVPGGTISGGAQRSIVWVNRQGREEPIKAPQRAYVIPRISPDGTRIALDVRDQEQDIWVWDIARQTLTRLTFDSANDQYPTWTPDSRRILFASSRSGVPNVYSQAADGTGGVERLTTSQLLQDPVSITPDGKHLLAFEVGAKTGPDVISIALGSSISDTGSRSGVAAAPVNPTSAPASPEAKPLVQTPFNEWLPEISPDGRWMAYASNESGDYEVYVRPFPAVDAGRWQVSTNRGSKPVWARNGRELFYMAPDGSVMAVPVQLTGPTFSADNPVKVVEGRYFVGPPPNRSYDVSPDGQRFLMIKDPTSDQATGASPVSLIVVINWHEEMRQRLGPR